MKTTILKSSKTPRLAAVLGLAAVAVALASNVHADSTRFVSTGNLITGRAAHTATLLGSGKVLIVGGVDSNSVAVAGSELYVRSQNKFVASGNLSTPRSRHTATRLFNGKVLIAGGIDNNFNPVSSLELYDASTGQFTPSHAALANGRYNHTAVLLPDGSGKVLIISGIGASGALSSVEIYNSVTDTVTPATPLNTGRYFDTATAVTAHGQWKVLVVGGFDANGNVLASAELYDPATGQWNYTGNLHKARYEADDAVLATGGVLISGGFDATGAPLASTEVYKPDNGQFLTTDNLDIARAGHTATRLATGKVLVAGGIGVATPAYPRQAEVYKSSGSKKNFAAGVFTDTGNSKMITGRIFHTATLMANGQVLFTGGLGESGLSLRSAEIFLSWAAEGGDDDDDNDCGND